MHLLYTLNFIHTIDSHIKCNYIIYINLYFDMNYKHGSTVFLRVHIESNVEEGDYAWIDTKIIETVMLMYVCMCVCMLETHWFLLSRTER